MGIVGGLDVHRRQITFDVMDTESGEVTPGQDRPRDRYSVRSWLGRFEGRADMAFA